MPMDEMSFIVTTLERINNRLDKHDDKLDLIVQVMQQLVKVDTETKELRESLGRAYKRLEAVENNQNTDGCQALKNFVVFRNEQLVHFKELAKNCQDNHDTLEERIEALEQKPLKVVDKFAMAIIGALGVGIGGWILLKFGVQTK